MSMSSPVPDLQRRFEQEGGKKLYVRKLFGRIARVYDLMNHVMTGGLDRRWRRYTVRQLALGTNALGLDVGTGTADLAFAALKAAGRAWHAHDRHRCDAADARHRPAEARSPSA